MSVDQLLEEIKEVNLAYLLLAQQMLRADRASAMFRLGIADEVAEIVANLTSAQLLRMASSNMLLCRFRFEDRLVAELLSSHQKSRVSPQSHAAVILAGQTAAGLV